MFVQQLKQLLAAGSCRQPSTLPLQGCVHSIPGQRLLALLQVLLQLPPRCWAHACSSNGGSRWRQPAASADDSMPIGSERRRQRPDNTGSAARATPVQPAVDKIDLQPNHQRHMYVQQTPHKTLHSPFFGAVNWPVIPPAPAVVNTAAVLLLLLLAAVPLPASGPSPGVLPPASPAAAVLPGKTSCCGTGSPCSAASCSSDCCSDASCGSCCISSWRAGSGKANCRSLGRSGSRSGLWWQQEQQQQ